jgi:hypothetical protein
MRAGNLETLGQIIGEMLSCKSLKVTSCVRKLGARGLVSIACSLLLLARHARKRGDFASTGPT